MTEYNNLYKKAGISLSIGMIQAVVGYPFDTLKTQAQKGIPFANTRISTLYNGFKYQLAISTINTSTSFLIFDYYYQQHRNPWKAGLTSAIISSVLVNSLEVYKVRSQIGQMAPSITLRPFTRLGFPLTLFRECIALPIYFGSYITLKENVNIIPTVVSGGLAGCASWAITYPVDTLKTLKQSDPKLQVIKTVLANPSILFRGFGICMFRAFLVNSINFKLYELHNYSSEGVESSSSISTPSNNSP